MHGKELPCLVAEHAHGVMTLWRANRDELVGCSDSDLLVGSRGRTAGKLLSGNSDASLAPGCRRLDLPLDCPVLLAS